MDSMKIFLQITRNNYNDRMVSCIILAAGESKRFGSPKALVMVKETTLIENLQTKILSTSVGEIIIVLGANCEKIEPFVLKHTKVKVVYNKDYILGQTSSFKTGLKTLSPSCRAVFLQPIDFPFTEADTFELLITQSKNSKAEILIPTYQNLKGHPPLFSSTLKSEFLNLSDETGLNNVSRQHSDQTKLIPVDDKGIILTFNTPEEFMKIKSRVKN
jgi:molybdenum cofactor cytidylyltransferase